MTARRPLVNVGGSLRELPTGDTLQDVAQWYFGTGTPLDAGGAPGDYYVGADNKLWRKGATTWTYTGVQYGSLVAVPSKTTPVDADVVSFGDSAAGGQMVKVTWSNLIAALPFRERIWAARTYFVRPDGSDSNTGLADTPGGAFLTIPRALAVASGLDFNTYNVTIKLADGTYPQIVAPPIVGNGVLWIVGNTASPSSVVIASSGAAPAVRVLHMNAYCQVQGVTLRGSNGPRAATVGTLSIRDCIIENVTQAAFDAQIRGRFVINGPVTIRNSPNMVRVFTALEAGVLYVTSGTTITIEGTPAVSAEFCGVTGTGSSAALSGVIFAGSVTGRRFSASLNATIDVGGAGLNFLPGNVAGVTLTGGQYS